MLWSASRVVAGVALVCASLSAAFAAGPRVALDTSLGRIVVELDPERAPQTVRNFLRYVAERHYDGTVFHRVVDGFVIQGGGLTADFAEKPTHPAIVNEATNGLSNAVGTIAMAREEAIDSATAQFFINVVDNPRLDHVDVPPEGVTVTRRGRDLFVPASDANRVYGYAVFGRVIAGSDVVDAIRRVPVRTVVRGDDTLENVPVDAVRIDRAVLLPPSNP